MLFQTMKMKNGSCHSSCGVVVEYQFHVRLFQLQVLAVMDIARGGEGNDNPLHSFHLSLPVTPRKEQVKTAVCETALRTYVFDGRAVVTAQVLSVVSLTAVTSLS